MDTLARCFSLHHCTPYDLLPSLTSSGLGRRSRVRQKQYSPQEKQCWRGELCFHTLKVHVCSPWCEMGKLRHVAWYRQHFALALVGDG